jgi:hypothetical protein
MVGPSVNPGGAAAPPAEPAAGDGADDTAGGPAGDWPRRAAALTPLIAGIVALALTRATMLPGVAYWDTGEFQTVAPVMGTAHPTGYPTYVILGWIANLILAPFGEPAFRMNLFAGICVAVAAGMVVVLVCQLTGRSAPGLAAGVGLAATPLAWQIGTHAEPHALHLALVAVLLVLLVGWERARGRGDPGADRWLVASAVAFGVAAANHSLTLLLAPAIALYVLAIQPGILRRAGLIALCAVALSGTMALLYLELPIRSGILRAPLVYGRPDTWDGFWYVALGQQFQGAVSIPLDDLPRKAGELAKLASEQLGFLALLLPAAFIVTAGRFPGYALLTGMAAAVTALFSASYVNADISRYYLGPVLMAWTWLGIMAAVVIERIADLGGPGWDISRAGRAVAVALAGLIIVPGVLAIPDHARQIDRSGDRSAATWLDAALGRIEENAVVISWWSYSTPLWYAQYVEGRRPDIFVVDDRTRLDLDLGEATDVVARFIGSRPVYVIRANQHDLDLITGQYRLGPRSEAASNLYQVLGPVEAGP